MFAEGISLAELPGAAADVAAFPVHYDEQRRLWYCDVVMEPGRSYYPFVRLALARFQPHSVQGVHLSTLLLADFAQLAPDRWAVARRDAANHHRYQVTVTGPAPMKSLAWKGPTRVFLRLEQQPRFATGDLGWIPVSSGMGDVSVELQPQQDRGLTVWRGAIEVPKPRSKVRYRLAVSELETFNVDRPSGSSECPKPPQKGPWRALTSVLSGASSNEEPLPTDDRLVFEAVMDIED
jgi:hypothetical protein